MTRSVNNFLLFSVSVLFLAACSSKETFSGDYPIKPLPFTSVRLTDNFWSPRVKKNAEVTIPIAFHHCETTGRIKNFEIAGVPTKSSS